MPSTLERGPNNLHGLGEYSLPTTRDGGKVVRISAPICPEKLFFHDFLPALAQPLLGRSPNSFREVRRTHELSRKRKACRKENERRRRGLGRRKEHEPLRLDRHSPSGRTRSSGGHRGRDGRRLAGRFLQENARRSGQGFGRGRNHRRGEDSAEIPRSGEGDLSQGRHRRQGDPLFRPEEQRRGLPRRVRRLRRMLPDEPGDTGRRGISWFATTAASPFPP